MEKEIICTVCPRGCHIQVEGERETVRQVTGYIWAGVCHGGIHTPSAYPDDNRQVGWRGA